MSRSTLHCKACKAPLATRHHSGQVTVESDARTVILPDGTVKVRCKCGAWLVIDTA